MLPSSVRAFAAQSAAPSSSKTASASLERRAGPRLLLRAALRRPEAEERPCSLERHSRRARAARGLVRTRRARRRRRRDAASRRAAAAIRGGERRDAVEGAAPLLEPGERALAPRPHRPRADERLDLVGNEADRARLADAGGEEPLALGSEQPRHLAGPAERELEDAERPDAVDPRRRHAPLAGELERPLARRREPRPRARARPGRAPAWRASTPPSAAGRSAARARTLPRPPAPPRPSGPPDTRPARAARGPSAPSPRRLARSHRRGSREGARLPSGPSVQSARTPQVEGRTSRGRAVARRARRAPPRAAAWPTASGRPTRHSSSPWTQSDSTSGPLVADRAASSAPRAANSTASSRSSRRKKSVAARPCAASARTRSPASGSSSARLASVCGERLVALEAVQPRERRERLGALAPGRPRRRAPPRAARSLAPGRRQSNE